MKATLEKLIKRSDLDSQDCSDLIQTIKKGIEPVQAGAFLALLQAKGLSGEELAELVHAFRKEGKSLKCPMPVLNIVGTGGDHAGTVNISTGASLLASRCGVPVLKHGNRAISSSCGAADVLEILGIRFDCPLEQLQTTGFAFCFAPDYYPILGRIREIRKSLGISSVFHLLGPLLHPAGLDHTMIGVFAPEFVPIVAKALFLLGTKRSLVFHGYGLDELSCLGPIDALLVDEQGISVLRIDPEKLGLKRCTKEDLKGGSVQDNALFLAAGLRGVSPLSDTLALNAGVGLYLYGRANTLEEGVAIAKQKVKGKSLKAALTKQKEAILAEIKRASPSRGKIGTIADVGKQALIYQKGGAAAISVLTNSRFEGSLHDLRQVAFALKETDIPVMRKDFITDPIEIAQAAIAGADAVLLIATHLKEKTLQLLEAAHKMGMEALVEVHKEEDKAYLSGAKIVGVNQRNLEDFSLDPAMHARWIGQIDPNLVKVAESGIYSVEDAKRSFALGYDALLVGEALTKAEDPVELLRLMRNQS